MLKIMIESDAPFAHQMCPSAAALSVSEANDYRHYRQCMTFPANSYTLVAK